MSNPHGTIEVDSYLPCGGRALIRPDPRRDKTQGGILLPGGGTHGNVRVGTMLDQGEPRWENGHVGPLPVPDFEDYDDDCRVLYFEARFTPVRVWTGNMEDAPDPAWRPPEVPTSPDANWKPEKCPQIRDPKWEKPALHVAGEPKAKAPLIDDPDWDEAAAEAKRPNIPDPNYVAPERPTIKVKAYEELHIIPHPAILGAVAVSDVPEDLAEEDKFVGGSVKAGAPLVRPSPQLTKAITERQVPRGKLAL